MVQHGYLTGRGVISAWRRLLLLVQQPNLYEFDLRGFFDRVSLPAINDELRRMLVPEKEIQWLWSINLKQPTGLKYTMPRDVQTVWNHNVITDQYKIVATKV